MRFTKYNSLNDILEYPHMQEYLHIFYSDYLLTLFSEENYHLPLAMVELLEKSPWDDPFSVFIDQLLDAANLVLDVRENGEREWIGLWESDLKWNLRRELQGGVHQVALVAPNQNRIKKSLKKRPAVIICPGGGYESVCFSGEGTPIMHYMEAQGYCAFILKYRVAPDRYPKPQEDLVCAIRYLRTHAKEYGIDEKDIMVLGASAGGHLAASMACLYPVDAPDKMCLCYPVISFFEEQHEGSFQNLTGGDESLRKTLSVEQNIIKKYPKTFVWACADDDCVPASNAVKMSEFLKNHSIEHKLHIYPTGGHGCALAFCKSARTWSQEMIRYFSDTRQG